MQLLTAPPRDHLSAEQVTDLLTGDELTVAAGCELLDTSNRLVADITDDLGEGGSVEWDNRDPIHGSCRLSLLRRLAWGRDRVRPYMVLSNAAVEARFNLGVYVLMTPDERRGEDPVTWEVTGYDLLSLLDGTGPADTWIAESGSTYFAALQAVVDASGIGVPLMLDGDAQDTTIPATRVWALIEPMPSWLRILTDLLNEIGYVAPWIDPDGNLRSRPFQDPAIRAAEWRLDTSDTSTNIVAEDRTITTETGDVANWWRFVRSDSDVTPVEGDGLYTPPANETVGPNSILALGREVRKFVRLQAADQAALVAQADRIVAADMASVRTIELSIDPLPIMGYGDVFELVDGGEVVKMAAASWTLNLDGSPGQLQLGGAPEEPADPMEQQTRATVTSAAPLRVVVDGATTQSFANALDAAVYEIGDRVTVTVRNPMPPLIQGVES